MIINQFTLQLVFESHLFPQLDHELHFLELQKYRRMNVKPNIPMTIGALFFIVFLVYYGSYGWK
jgi:hypothetical protein